MYHYHLVSRIISVKEKGSWNAVRCPAKWGAWLSHSHYPSHYLLLIRFNWKPAGLTYRKYQFLEDCWQQMLLLGIRESSHLSASFSHSFNIYWTPIMFYTLLRVLRIQQCKRSPPSQSHGLQTLGEEDRCSLDKARGPVRRRRRIQGQQPFRSLRASLT